MNKKELYKKRREQFLKINDMKNIRCIITEGMDKLTVATQKEKFKYDFYNYLLKNEKKY